VCISVQCTHSACQKQCLGLFHTRLFCCMFVSPPRGCLVLVHACAYIYIGRIYKCMCIYYKHIHTESTCVWIDAARRAHMCLGIYLSLYTQGLHVYIYVYAHRVHKCGYIFTYIHPRFICACVYITYLHTEFTCACVYNCNYTHRVYICMCIF